MLWAFDLMALNGNDLRIVALEDRKRRLGHLIERSAISRLLHSEAFDDGERLKYRRRDREAELLCRLEVNFQLEPACLIDRESPFAP